jgi:hypothetical protein
MPHQEKEAAQHVKHEMLLSLGSFHEVGDEERNLHYAFFVIRKCITQRTIAQACCPGI